MALGGGTFTTYNQVLPGAYINFVSSARADAALSERGIAAMALEWDWGPQGEVFSVDAQTFQKNAKEIFGYDYTHEKLKGLRDLFSNIRTLYAYRLGSGTKASNTVAEAKYPGERGNDLSVSIHPNADEPEKFDVSTLLDGKVLETQTVSAVEELQENAFLTFQSDAPLSEQAGLPLTGGENGAEAQGEDYQGFLNQIERYSFHTLGCLSTDAKVTALFSAFTKRMREEQGVKFQTVLYRCAADYEGVISVQNRTLDADWPESSLVYWVTGASAGCEINRSNTNRAYTGEFTVETVETQEQLKTGLQSGQLLFHRVGDEVRVLRDVNTLTTQTPEKGADFGSNQTVRVLDQIGTDIAALFNGKYLGKVPNDAAGRISLWNDIVKRHESLLSLRAIENFNAEDISVMQGETKQSVIVADRVTPVNCMEQLYMTVTVE